MSVKKLWKQDKATSILGEIYAEIRRQWSKFGSFEEPGPTNRLPAESTPVQNAVKLAILTEEIGEVADIVNDIILGKYNPTTDYEVIKNLKKELVQVAAVATHWMLALERDFPEPLAEYVENVAMRGEREVREPEIPNCAACSSAMMEPDGPLVCGHPLAGFVGRNADGPSSPRHPASFCGPKGRYFTQHPHRNTDGTLRQVAASFDTEEKDV